MEWLVRSRKPHKRFQSLSYNDDVLLVIDNYDSFTFNLVQRIGEVDAAQEVCVRRNDEVTVSDIERLRPSHVIISPGPGTPRDTGVCQQLVQCIRGRAAIFGVCLGHQVIAAAFSMRVGRHDRPMHGKTSLVHHDGLGLFAGVPNPFPAARYHSLIVRREDVHADFEVSAWTDDDEVMGLRWRKGAPSTSHAEQAPAPLEGVQFHPESYLTEIGGTLIANFLRCRSCWEIEGKPQFALQQQ